MAANYVPEIEYAPSSISNPGAVIMWLRTWVLVGKPDECWPTMGNTNVDGYATVWQTVDGVSTVKGGHRIMWELFNGPIEKGMVIDHMCHNEAWANGTCDSNPCTHRRCVNPSHLRAVSHKENMQAGKSGFNENSGYCRKGIHEWTEENIYTNGAQRWCRVCAKENKAQRREEENAKNRARRAAKKAGK